MQDRRQHLLDELRVLVFAVATEQQAVDAEVFELERAGADIEPLDRLHRALGALERGPEGGRTGFDATDADLQSQGRGQGFERIECLLQPARERAFAEAFGQRGLGDDDEAAAPMQQPCAPPQAAQGALECFAQQGAVLMDGAVQAGRRAQFEHDHAPGTGARQLEALEQAMCAAVVDAFAEQFHEQRARGAGLGGDHGTTLEDLDGDERRGLLDGLGIDGVERPVAAVDDEVAAACAGDRDAYSRDWQGLRAERQGRGQAVAQAGRGKLARDQRRLDRPAARDQRPAQAVEQQQAATEQRMQRFAHGLRTARADGRVEQPLVGLDGACQARAFLLEGAKHQSRLQAGGEQRSDAGEYVAVGGGEVAVPLVDGVEDAEWTIAQDQRHGNGVVGVEQAHEALYEARIVLRVVGDVGFAREEHARGVAAVAERHPVLRHGVLGMHAESRRLQHELVPLGLVTHEAAARGTDGPAHGGDHLTEHLRVVARRRHGLADGHHGLQRACVSVLVAHACPVVAGWPYSLLVQSRQRLALFIVLFDHGKRAWRPLR